jgi:outer membrane lipoprotein LolB
VQFVRLLASGLVLALLLSCASSPPVPPIESTRFIEEFELTGRVAVKFDGRGYSARIRWQHEAGFDAIWLYSPVGSTIATMTARGDRATLVTAKKETFTSNNVQGLTRKVLGWDLPLTGLRHWVLGRVDPEVPVAMLEYDDRMRIRYLSQGEWNIDYLAYAEDGVLPSSMVLHYTDLRLRLIIDGWKISSQEQ